MRDPAPRATTERQIVFILDDDASVREALSSFLRSAGLQVTAFATASEFLQARLPDAPACLVLDLQLPDIGGLELQRALAETQGPPIVFISGKGTIPASVSAMKAGAIEFFPKPVDDEELLNAIYKALEQDREDRLQRSAMASLESSYASLSPREREVLPLIVSGRTNRESANNLGIAEITLQVHRGQIMRKLGARSLPELVNMATKLRLL
jgi:FixJ family two-component response regulator